LYVDDDGDLDRETMVKKKNELNVLLVRGNKELLPSIKKEKDLYYNSLRWSLLPSFLFKVQQWHLLIL